MSDTRNFSTPARWREHVRRRAGGLLFRTALDTLARAGRAHPRALWHQRDVEVVRDLAYRDASGGEHSLDVYLPRDRPAGALPCVLYLHGGAFCILSKDTHWMMGLQFARAGYVVFNANYRLAPRHPYPAAAEDAVSALLWVMRHAPRFGADPRRIVVAGESAGANLATSLAVASAYPRPEPWARPLFDAPLRPAAIVAACGILQVTDSDRIRRRTALSPWLADRLVELESAYYPPAVRPPGPLPSLADPLVVLERMAPARPLPPFFIFVGTADPLLDDSRRLKAALDHLHTPAELRIYGGGLHAFHAVYWGPRASRAWAHKLSFLERALAGGLGPT